MSEYRVTCPHEHGGQTDHAACLRWQQAEQARVDAAIATAVSEAYRAAAAGATLALANEVGGHTSTYSVRRWLEGLSKLHAVKAEDCVSVGFSGQGRCLEPGIVEGYCPTHFLQPRKVRA